MYFEPPVLQQRGHCNSIGGCMNLGRFHYAVALLVRSYKTENIEAILAKVLASLQQSISQPNESTSAAFKTAYSELEKILTDSQLNFVGPIRHAIFIEIGADRRIGVGLLSRVRDAISQNQIVPSQAHKEITEINVDIVKYFNDLNQVDTVFTDLEIEYDELGHGAFEVGISMPHDISGETLEGLEKEIHKVDSLLKTFNELVCQDSSSPIVKTISASEWQFFINSVPEVAACIAIAIERIVALYKSNLEIRLIKEQLTEKKLPKNVTKPLEDHIKKAVKEEIDKLSANIVESNYKQEDIGRKNELIVKLSKDLTYLADRIDKGATFEVRAEPTKKPEEQEGEEEKFKKDMIRYKKENKLVVDVNRISHIISALERSDGPTLMLPSEVEVKQPSKG